MKKILYQQQKIASTYDDYSEVTHLIGERLLEKLDFIKLCPWHILDLGTGTGQFLKPLKLRFPKAKIIGVDLSLAMLKQNKKKQGWFNKFPLLRADAKALPLKDNSIDFIFANSFLQYCIDLSEVFREIARVLKPEGLFLFSSCGPDTLKELKIAWQHVDGYDHVNRLTDMHDIADMLLHQGFSDPVVDMEMLTVNYPSLNSLLKELKYSGSVNLGHTICHGLTSSSQLTKLNDNYPIKDGYYPATIEIIYGHAWGSAMKYSQPDNAGVVNIPIDKIRRK